MATTWWSYVERVGKGAAQKDIAEQSGIDAGALSRWKTGQTPRPSAELAIQFARAYSRPPAEALVAAGFITEGEAGKTIEVHRGLSDVADDELIEELKVRLAGRQPIAAEPSPEVEPLHKSKSRRFRSGTGTVGDLLSGGAPPAAADDHVEHA